MKGWGWGVVAGGALSTRLGRELVTTIPLVSDWGYLRLGVVEIQQAVQGQIGCPVRAPSLAAAMGTATTSGIVGWNFVSSSLAGHRDCPRLLLLCPLLLLG